jgi:hypothetical protein
LYGSRIESRKLLLKKRIGKQNGMLRGRNIQVIAPIIANNIHRPKDQQQEESFTRLIHRT